MNKEQVKAALLLTEIVVRLEHNEKLENIKPLLEKIPPEYLPVPDTGHYIYALETGRAFYVHSRLQVALENLKGELGL